MNGFGSIRHRETAEARLQQLNNNFRAVSKNVGRSTPKKWMPPITAGQTGVCVLMASVVAIGGVLFFTELRDHKWPVSTTLKHIAAAPNCAAARAVGLAPATDGVPGYYFRHDTDQDGTACEPRPIY